MTVKRDPAPARWTLIRGARQLLTLQGATGPRIGAAMNRLEVIPNGAMLIRDGVIECVGPSNRVENLAGARTATEIDASGKVVMPAFVEPDARILYDPSLHYSSNPDSSNSDLSNSDLSKPDSSKACMDISQSLRVTSRHKLLQKGAANGGEYARYGVLTAGVATLFALELKVVLKILSTQHALQSRPLRLRGIIATDFAAAQFPEKFAEQIAEKWIPLIKERKLSSIVELSSSANAGAALESASQTILLAAAAAGFTIRIRSFDGAASEILRVAQTAGAVALLSPGRNEMLEKWPARGNMVFVLSTNLDDPRQESDPAIARRFIEHEIPFAISMGWPTADSCGRNTQHALYTAARYYKLTAEEAITAATVNAACSLRTSHLTGALEPGKSADVTIMNVSDYRELVKRPGLSSVEWVLSKGRVVYGRTPLILD